MNNISIVLLFLGLCLLVQSEPVQGGNLMEGQSLYGQQCALCHGDSGKPMMPGTPDLSRQEGMRTSNSRLLQRLKEGNGSCPPFGGLLTDMQLANIISFIRTLERR